MTHSIASTVTSRKLADTSLRTLWAAFHNHTQTHNVHRQLTHTITASNTKNSPSPHIPTYIQFHWIISTTSQDRICSVCMIVTLASRPASLPLAPQVRKCACAYMHSSWPAVQEGGMQVGKCKCYNRAYAADAILLQPNSPDRYCLAAKHQSSKQAVYDRQSDGLSNFYRTCSYASAVLGVIILSVSVSVRPSHVHFVTKSNNALQIFWYHTKGQSF